MRRLMILTTAALITAIPLIWGATAILAKALKGPNADPATPVIDVMQMMKKATDLPEQHYDAH